MTHKTKAITAETEGLASAKVSLCNAGGVCFMGSPEGPGPGTPQGVVARSLRARGTRRDLRLALWPARPGRGSCNSVNRP